VHKRTCSLVAICEDVIVKRWSMKADVEACRATRLKFFAGANIFSVYEAGFSGYSLHRELLKHGIGNIVISSASVQKAPNDRVKTDATCPVKMSNS
jgi:transposase